MLDLVDMGCLFYPTCLACPLPECEYDNFHDVFISYSPLVQESLKELLGNEEIRQLYIIEGLGLRELVARFKLETLERKMRGPGSIAGGRSGAEEMLPSPGTPSIQGE